MALLILNFDAGWSGQYQALVH